MTAARTAGDVRRFLANSCRPTESTLRKNWGKCHEVVTTGSQSCMFAQVSAPPMSRKRCGLPTLGFLQSNAFARVGSGAGNAIDLREGRVARDGHWGVGCRPHDAGPGSSVNDFTGHALGDRSRSVRTRHAESRNRRTRRNCESESAQKD